MPSWTMTPVTRVLENPCTIPPALADKKYIVRLFTGFAIGEPTGAAESPELRRHDSMLKACVAEQGSFEPMCVWLRR